MNEEQFNDAARRFSALIDLRWCISNPNTTISLRETIKDCIYLIQTHGLVITWQQFDLPDNRKPRD